MLISFLRNAGTLGFRPLITRTVSEPDATNNIARFKAYIAQQFRRAVVVKVDNVAEYFTEHHVKNVEGRHIVDRFAACPVQIQPWPITFYEFTARGTTRSRLYSDPIHSNAKGVQVGMLAECWKLDNVIDKAAYAVRCFVFERDLDNPGIASIEAMYRFNTAEDGHHIEPLIGILGQTVMTGDPLKPDDKLFSVLRGHIDDCISPVIPCFLATTFLHCKNVTIEDRTDNVFKCGRRGSGKKKAGSVTYKTLAIDPMKAILKHEGGIEQNGIAKALHICRGHFKDYREHGLFGRNKGLYWWDMHVRGSADRGVVVKDYEIAA